MLSGLNELRDVCKRKISLCTVQEKELGDIETLLSHISTFGLDIHSSFSILLGNQLRF